MGLLGKQTDPSPGINSHCDRAWRVNDFRQYVRRALEQAGLTKAIRPTCTTRHRWSVICLVLAGSWPTQKQKLPLSHPA